MTTVVTLATRGLTRSNRTRLGLPALGESERAGQSGIVTSLTSGKDAMHHAWGVAVGHYLVFLAAGGASPATVRLRRNQLTRLSRFVGGLSPWLVTTDHLLGFLASNPLWQPETRHALRSAVRGFYSWAEETKRVERSPAGGRALPRVKRPRHLPRPAPESMIAAALDSAELRPARRRYSVARRGADERLMIMLAAYAGLRRGEIARVHSRWLVGDEMYVLGKGGKTRTVPIHPAIAVELEPYRDGYDDFVFPGGDAGHVSPSWVGVLLRRHLGQPGHTLRHRFGTVVRDVSDIAAAKELLGHEKLDTTLIYTRITGDELRAAVLAAGPATALTAI